MRAATSYQIITLRGLTHQERVWIAPVITHHYPGLGYITPIMRGRIQSWYISKDPPSIGPDNLLNMATVNSHPYDRQSDAYAALLAGEHDTQPVPLSRDL